MYRGEPKVPARQDVLDVEPIASDPFVETWLEQAQVGEPLPNIPAMSSVWKAWGDAADAIITNNAPDEEIQGILDTAVQQIKDEIAKTQQ
jgi:maltose-binding protein MalE